MMAYKKSITERIDKYWKENPSLTFAQITTTVLNKCKNVEDKINYKTVNDNAFDIQLTKFFIKDAYERSDRTIRLFKTVWDKIILTDIDLNIFSIYVDEEFKMPSGMKIKEKLSLITRKPLGKFKYRRNEGSWYDCPEVTTEWETYMPYTREEILFKMI